MKTKAERMVPSDGSHQNGEDIFKLPLKNNQDQR